MLPDDWKNKWVYLWALIPSYIKDKNTFDSVFFNGEVYI